MTKLAQRIKAKRLSTSYGSTLVYNTAGSPLSLQEQARLDQLSRQVSQALKQAQSSDNDISVKQTIESLFHQANLDMEERQFLNFILSGSIEQEYAGSASELSTQWYDDAKSFRGDDALFASGFGVLVAPDSKNQNLC